MAKIRGRDVIANGLEGLFFPWWRDAVWADSASGYAKRNAKIRQLAESGFWTYDAIGALFNLNPSSISLIARKR